MLFGSLDATSILAPTPMNHYLETCLLIEVNWDGVEKCNFKLGS